MLSVQESAEKLGVSGARVRAMLKDGILEGSKIGRTWAVSESSVAERLQQDVHPGRPATTTPVFERSIPDIDAAHAIYDESSKILAGCYNAAFLQQARSEEEQAFWIYVSDFFLQRKQKDLIAQGVY